MKRIAVIKDGIVVNLALWDGKSEWSPGKDLNLLEVDPDSDIECGDIYDEEIKELKKLSHDEREEVRLALSKSDVTIDWVKENVAGKIKTLPSPKVRI